MGGGAAVQNSSSTKKHRIFKKDIYLNRALPAALLFSAALLPKHLIAPCKYKRVSLICVSLKFKNQRQQNHGLSTASLTNSHQTNIETKHGIGWNFIAGAFSPPGQFRRYPKFIAAANIHHLQAFL